MYLCHERMTPAVVMTISPKYKAIHGEITCSPSFAFQLKKVVEKRDYKTA